MATLLRIALLLLGGFVTDSIGQDDHEHDDHDHVNCVEAMFHGLEEAYANLNRYHKLGLEGLPCPLAESILEDKFQHSFRGAGCSWGYSQETFEKRIKHYARELFDGECEYLDWTKDFTEEELLTDGIQCSAEEELMTAADKFLKCGAANFTAVFLMGVGRDDVCRIARNEGPCLEGIVDQCHSDDGAATESVIDLLLAVLTTYAKEDGDTREFLAGLNECSEEDIGVFHRIKDLSYDWEPKLMSDEELIGYSDGVKLVPSPRMNQVLKRLECLYFESMGLPCVDGFSMLKSVVDHFL